ncbi:ABC transporter permease [Chryseolinea sp. T2]|uniref:ABC transporter permease n=1 Tax=Chryseolinea sp. T2 TaxID=3129255 RepID=UPI0030787BBD
MFRNHFKVALRNLLRHKMYSLINIGGLAVGMSVAIMIGLWVYDEVSYNHSYKNYDHIAMFYRTNVDPVDHTKASWFGTAQPVAKILTEKYGHLFKNVAIMWWETDYALRVGDRNYSKTGQYIDKSAIDLFSMNMARGNVNSLDDPNAIIMSKSAAESIFGNEDPIGQTVRINASRDAIITGVYDNMAANSYFSHIQFFGNFEGLKNNTPVMKANETNWGNNASRIIVQTADNVSIEQANAVLADLYLKDTPEGVAKYSREHQTQVWLNPIKNWYLYSEFKDGYPNGGRITFVWLFGIVGAFVLLLACINFMNLSTARSEKRAREVGVRKAIGSMRSQLVNQFLSESFMIVFISFMVSMLIVLLMLPAFNQLADKKISMPFANIYFWMASLGFLIITAFLAGLYPAFYLSSFQPVKVLKGTFRVGKFASMPRKFLVVIQVGVSAMLIIGTIIVYQQIQFTQARPVGYDRQNLIRIAIHDAEFNKSKLVMKDQLLSSGIATDLAFASSPVTAIWDNWSGFNWRGKNPDTDPNFTVTWIDEEYGKTIQWKILKGRDFSREHSTDVDAVVINRAAADYIGFENPIGETINAAGKDREIIGVVEDVIAHSPYEAVGPGFYWLDKGTENNSLGQMIIRLDPSKSTAESMAGVEQIHGKLVTSSTLDYNFVDDEYGVKFQAEQRIGNLASVFAVLAIFISCLGLFGLSSFMAEQKTKEIGVRKVIGASLVNIWVLLSKEFVVLVSISLLGAMPIAWYYLQQWLLTYHYHTQINWWVFVIAGSSVLLITLVTVSFHGVRAAVANPVKSLRSE